MVDVPIYTMLTSIKTGAVYRVFTKLDDGIDITKQKIDFIMMPKTQNTQTLRNDWLSYNEFVICYMFVPKEIIQRSIYTIFIYVFPAEFCN